MPRGSAKLPKVISKGDKMTHWSEYSEADFDRSRAPRGAARRAAETADQAGLFFVATPVTRPAKTKHEPDNHVDGDVALFDLTGGDTQ